MIGVVHGWVPTADGNWVVFVGNERLLQSTEQMADLLMQVNPGVSRIEVDALMLRARLRAGYSPSLAPGRLSWS